jgi:hypothetical protein
MNWSSGIVSTYLLLKRLELWVVRLKPAFVPTYMVVAFKKINQLQFAYLRVTAQTPNFHNGKHKTSKIIDLDLYF